MWMHMNICVQVFGGGGSTAAYFWIYLMVICITAISVGLITWLICICIIPSPLLFTFFFCFHWFTSFPQFACRHCYCENSLILFSNYSPSYPPFLQGGMYPLPPICSDYLISAITWEKYYEVGYDEALRFIFIAFLLLDDIKKCRLPICTQFKL